MIKKKKNTSNTAAPMLEYTQLKPIVSLLLAYRHGPTLLVLHTGGQVALWRHTYLSREGQVSTETGNAISDKHPDLQSRQLPTLDRIARQRSWHSYAHSLTFRGFPQTCVMQPLLLLYIVYITSPKATLCLCYIEQFPICFALQISL